MTVKILVGDCRQRLSQLPDKSIDMAMTSPPYWGLRAYGTEPQVWGGDSSCSHVWGAMEHGKRKDMLPADETTSAARSGTDDRQDGASHNGGNFCEACGAWRGEHGMEPTLEMWLENEVLIWREVRRVLRDEGTAWINIGDSYATKPAGRSAEWYKRKKRDDRAFRDKPFTTVSASRRPEAPDTLGSAGLASKQRLMLPARLALALQADGWWLRDEIVWAKPNPMPSSVEDRTTPAHEMLYLFAKSGRALFWTHRDTGLPGRVYKRPAPDFRFRHRRTGEEMQALPVGITDSDKKDWMQVNLWQGHDYYYDADAIAETCVKTGTPAHLSSGANSREHIRRTPNAPNPNARNANKPVAGWQTGPGSHSTIDHAAPRNISGNKVRKFGTDVGSPDDSGKEHQGRSVPWAPVANPDGLFMRNKRSVWNVATEPFPEAHFATFPTALVEPCIKAGCPAGGTVLDPFGGAGTTGLVADRLGRNAILIELNPEYAAIAVRRIQGDQGPLLVDVAAE